MKTIHLILVAALPLIAGADDKPKKPATDGTWLAQSATHGDNQQPIEDAVLKSISVEMKGNAYTVIVDGQVSKGTFKLLPKTKPQAMDLTNDDPNEAKTIQAIVELKGDTMKVCHGLGGKRPDKFDTAGQAEWLLIVYKRKKE